jgi:hypothetical protein
VREALEEFSRKLITSPDSIISGEFGWIAFKLGAAEDTVAITGTSNPKSKPN